MEGGVDERDVAEKLNFEFRCRMRQIVLLSRSSGDCSLRKRLAIYYDGRRSSEDF